MTWTAVRGSFLQHVVYVRIYIMHAAVAACVHNRLVELLSY